MTRSDEPFRTPPTPTPSMPMGAAPMGAARLWLLLGAIAGVTAVAMGAVLAHLGPRLLSADSERMARNALQMQGWHALALLAVAILAQRPQAGLSVHIAGGCFAAGLVLFCGAVDVLAFTGRHLGPATPLGGLLLMAGWLALAVQAIRGNR